MEHNAVVVLNKDGIVNSLQISYLGDIPAGEFDFWGSNRPFLVKNITDSNITIRGRLVSAGNSWIETVLYPGWNVEIFVKLNDIPANSLQYGY